MILRPRKGVVDVSLVVVALDFGRVAPLYSTLLGDGFALREYTCSCLKTQSLSPKFELQSDSK